MSYSGRSGSSLTPVLVVFGLGAGLGFAWKQGWLPIEILPAQTGVVEPAAVDADPPLELAVTPLVTTAPGPQSLEADRVPSGGVISLGPAAPKIGESPNPFPPDTAAAASATVAAGVDGSAPRRLLADPMSQLAASRATPIQDPDVKSAAYVAAEPSSAGDSLNETAESNDLETLLAEYDAKLAAGEVLSAHRLLSQAYWKDRSARPRLLERLDQSAAVIFFRPQPHFVEPYEIQPGDRLEAIAAQYQVPWEYLSKLNRVDPRRIQAGRRLKVVRGPFSAVVELDDFSLTVHLQGYYVRRFPVGIGRDGSSPIGKFPVLNKVVNPQYTDPDGRVMDADDPANPLGERWIDLGNSYGIHGTVEPESIGKASSRGCIRLNDADVVAVYDFLNMGSEVAIRR